MPIRLHHLDPATRSIGSTVLPLDGPESACTVYLKALPGAYCVHILLESDGGGPSRRAEVDADPGDPVGVVVSRHPDGLAVSSSRRVLLFPPETRYEPPKLLFPAKDGKLDLLFLFDATSRMFHDHVGALKPRTDGSGEAKQLTPWQSHLDRLLEFSDGLRQAYADSRVGCAAFGDLPMTELAGVPDLECKYVFHPTDFTHRFLDPLSREQLRDEFNMVEYTPGADFVDALAEAFQSCQKAGWRPGARKVLVLSGDSPGSTAIDGPPPGSDAQVRRFDTRTEASRLQEQFGVEILTIYLESGIISENARPFVDYTRMQYRNLATLRAYAWTGESFDPVQAAGAVSATADGMGLALRRGYGLLDRIEGVA